MIVTCYTDASFNSDLDVSVCGYSIYKDDTTIKNSVTLVEGIGRIDKAEIHSIVQALQYAFLLPNVTGILLYTDQIGARSVNQRTRKMKYKEVAETIEICNEHNIQVFIFHVKGHITGKQTLHQKRHTKIDQHCRRELRNYLNKIKNGSNIKRRH